MHGGRPGEEQIRLIRAVIRPIRMEQFKQFEQSSPAATRVQCGGRSLMMQGTTA
jgi:hypothetical protein